MTKSERDEIVYKIDQKLLSCKPDQKKVVLNKKDLLLIKEMTWSYERTIEFMRQYIEGIIVEVEELKGRKS